LYQLKQLVREPYETSDHERACVELKKQLSNGETVCAKPVSIINVLWDSVIRKDVYINEMAMLFSLQDENGIAESGDA